MGSRGRMISASDRIKVIELIDAARQAGSRLEPACQIVNISVRTYKRWKREGDKTETKTNYPTDDALRKSIYLSVKEISRKWYNPIKNWGIIFGQFTVFYGDRFTEADIV